MLSKLIHRGDLDPDDFLEEVNKYMDGFEKKSPKQSFKNLLAFCVIAIERLAHNRKDPICACDAQEILNALFDSGQNSVMTGIIVALLKRNHGALMIDSKEIESDEKISFRISQDKIYVELEDSFVGGVC
jgi:hypothetical protein